MTGYESKKKAAQDKLEQAKEILLQHPQKDIDWQREQQIKAHTKLDEEGMYLVHQTAQPEQEPVAWKLMPRDATDAMLKAMDECSTEGYDERLYAGHAASVYMAAWDEALTSPFSIRNGDTTGRWSGKTENIGCLGMPVNVPVTPPQRTEQEPWCMKMNGCKTECEDCPDEAALAQPAQQKPFAYWFTDTGRDATSRGWFVRCPCDGKLDGKDGLALYTFPPQRPWVGLTAEEAAECWTTSATQTWKNFEAKLKEKNS